MRRQRPRWDVTLIPGLVFGFAVYEREAFVAVGFVMLEVRWR